MKRRTWTALAATAAAIVVMPVAAAAVDPIFANSFESGLIGFGPALSLLPAPAMGTATVDSPLLVTLSAPAQAPTFVAIASSEPSQVMVVGGGVTVPTGETMAEVLLDALYGGTEPVTLWATLGNTLGASVLVQEALNETGAGAEADFCNVQFPFNFSVQVDAATPVVYGQLYEAGVTEPDGPPSGWTAEVGYGPQNTDPRALAGWHFFAAAYNVQVGNNDEFGTSFTAPSQAGTYSYAFRFSNDGGATFTYCDTDGAGSNDSLSFDPSADGTMTVTGP